MPSGPPKVPGWRIALRTLLIEASSLVVGLTVPGFLLVVLSSGCFSPGWSDPTEPQMFDPALAIGWIALSAVLVITAVLGLKLLFAGERGDAVGVRRLRCQLAVQFGLILTIAAVMAALADPHRIDYCYTRH